MILPSGRRATAMPPRAWLAEISTYSPVKIVVPDRESTEPRESFLAPRRIGAGSVSTTILVILVFVVICTLAAVRMS